MVTLDLLGGLHASIVTRSYLEPLFLCLPHASCYIVLSVVIPYYSISCLNSLVLVLHVYFISAL